MSERLKYSNNGVYKIENFVQCLATGQFPEQSIGNYSWIFGSFITLKIREEYNQLYPYIVFSEDRKCQIRAFFNVNSKFWSLCYQTNGSIYLESDQGVSGPSITIQDVLNEENGYLENGAMTVEYGFHIDAILGYDNIWMFNLHSKLFDSEQESNTAANQYSLDHGVFEYYSPKPRLVFHSPLFDHETNEILLEDTFDASYAIDCLQIVNGVRLQYRSYQAYEWFNIAKVGRKLNMMNVVHYCDSMIIRTSPLKTEKYLKTAIQLNMRQCALHTIELWNLKELLEELKEDLDEIPGEMLKVITRKFINEEF